MRLTAQHGALGSAITDGSSCDKPMIITAFPEINKGTLSFIPGNIYHLNISGRVNPDGTIVFAGREFYYLCALSSILSGYQRRRHVAGNFVKRPGTEMSDKTCFLLNRTA